jgi:hypothetical protein
MSLVHLIRSHRAVPFDGLAERGSLSGAKPSSLMPFREWETEPFLGFDLHGLCKTLWYFYASSQPQVATQAAAALAVMFSSILVVFRV